jgi:hypothetical protein
MSHLLADAVLVAHVLFIGFVLGGGLLLWRWPEVVWLHVPAVAWGAFVEFVGWECPLTPLENHFRTLGGGRPYEGDFVARYLLPAVYPGELSRTMQFMLGTIVVLVNGVLYARFIWGGGRGKRRGQ